MRKMLLVLLVVAVIPLGACVETLRTVQTAAQIYRTGKTATQGYYSVKMVKSLKDAEPLFDGYDSVKVETLIVPRDEEKTGNIISAFKDNLYYIVETDLQVVQSGKSICSGESCSGKTMLIQFREKDYNSNTAQRIFMGNKLRGKLYYIDKQTGTVIKEEDLEAVSNYKQILEMIHTSVVSKLLKSIKDASKAQEAVNRVNRVDPIKPEYKELFKES